MDGFRTARVLVLDDDPAQAMPVIHALGMLGIGAIYHNGAVENLLPTKLIGVRVMFVDMVLAEHGAKAEDPKGCVAMVTDMLGKLVEDSSDPLLVICWTGHEDMAGEFQSVLKKTFPRAKMDAIVVAEKLAFSKPDDIEKLKKLIADAMAAQNPVNVLFRWEQLVHDAATRTTSTITELIRQFDNGDGRTWNDRAYQICAALALAERGSRLIRETEANAVKSLFDALNPLLNDRLDHDLSAPNACPPEVAKKLLDTVKAEIQQWDTGHKAQQNKQQRVQGIEFVQQNYSAEVPQGKIDALPPIPSEAMSLLSSQLRAALNAMVHVSTNVVKAEVYPGSVYFVERSGENRKRVDDKFVNWQEVGEDTLYPFSPKEPENHIPLIMEFSASCDFAHEKIKLPRFVCGFLVPERAIHTLRETALYIRNIGPLLLSNEKEPKLDGVYYLVLNTHYIIGVQRRVVSELIPTFRLRMSILADVTAWVSNHINRPGALHVGP